MGFVMKSKAPSAYASCVKPLNGIATLAEEIQTRDACTGAFIPEAGGYQQNLVVTAVPDLGPDGLDFVARQPVPCLVDGDGALRQLWRHPIQRREFGAHVTNVIRGLFLEARGYAVRRIQ